MADFNKSQGTWGRDANVSGACKAWINFEIIQLILQQIWLMMTMHLLA